MTTFTGREQLGDIVTQLPRASEVFKSYQIDFCCGGNRLLNKAAQEKGLDLQEVMDALEAMVLVVEETKDLIHHDDLTAVALIEYIEATHHQFLRLKLPEVSELVATIMEVHGLKHKELYELHRLFHTLKMDIEQHLLKEEQQVFPVIKDYGYHKTEVLLNKALETLKEIEDEHDGAGDLLKEIRRVTNNFTLPVDACPTYIAAYDGLQAIEGDLFEHVHLENNILFKKLKEGRY